KVYDVSSYLNDHPGGAEVMMEVAGQDATNMFEDIGHSTDARTEMKKFEIGLLKVRRRPGRACACTRGRGASTFVVCFCPSHP
ncbi:unnamed protein product, partial [Hapterophycus canaliculatus]